MPKLPEFFKYVSKILLVIKPIKVQKTNIHN